MSEHFGKVLVYSLNCDHPNHDREAYAKKHFAAPDADEWAAREPTTVAECRRLAKLDGWKIKGGIAICEMCQPIPSPSTGEDTPMISPREQLIRLAQWDSISWHQIAEAEKKDRT